MTTCEQKQIEKAYSLKNSTPVESRHCTLGRPRIVVLDKAVVEALGLLRNVG